MTSNTPLLAAGYFTPGMNMPVGEEDVRCNFPFLKRYQGFAFERAGNFLDFIRL
jgi:hypothetical protein